MKTKTLLKLLIAFSLSAVVSVGIILACAGGDEYEFSYSNFAPEPHVDKSYTPLFYSEYEVFYGITFDGEFIERFNTEIVKDWKGFLGNNLKEEKISFLLFDEKSEKTIDDLYAYVSKKVKTGGYTEWSSVTDLNNNEVKAFIEFLFLAKKVQKGSVKTFDPWDSENADKPVLVESGTISMVKSKYESEKNPFLKNRYWFQTIKAYFYSDSKEEAKVFFDKTQNEVPKNTLYYRAISYLAGIAYSSGDYAQSNYLYSIVFDKCSPMRVTATYCFRPKDEKDWNSALALAKNADEKAALWALIGFYADESRAINEIYKLNPKSPHLDYLLTRLINKTEKNLGNIEIESVSKYRVDIKNKLDKQAVSMVSSIAQAANTGKPYLWNMAAGYLQTFAGEYVQARNFFDKSEKQMPVEQTYKDQLRLLRLINKISETTVMDSKAENILLSDLQWLYLQFRNTNPNNFRSDQVFSWSKQYISSLYKSANNLVYKQIFNPDSKYYLDNANVEALKSFLEKQNKTPFEKLLDDISPVAIGSLYEYQAVLATFDNKIDVAYELMKKAESRKDIVLKGNPFNGFVKDCHDCEHAMTQKTKFSKLRFVEILQIMQGKIAKGEEVYNNNLLLGNSFYNITFYGNARVFYEGAIIGSEMGTVYSIDESYRQMLLNMKYAKYYYEQALKAATTNEQKAKCHYLLAKCERNDYYNTNSMGFGSWNENTKDDFLAWTGFKKLKTQYSGTKYYQEVIKECGYFATYAKN